MDPTLNRRVFLATSAASLAAVAVAPRPTPGRTLAQPSARPLPTGPVCGRIGPLGIAPGSAAKPSRGEVILLDDRALEATHVTNHRLEAGKSVLIAPEGRGWSILYAEF